MQSPVLDVKNAFLASSASIFQGLRRLFRYRITANTASLIILSVNLLDRDKYTGVETNALTELKRITPDQYLVFDEGYAESTIVFAYSILESFLSDAEEALYLSFPRKLGDGIQVSLGKLLSVETLREAIYDVVCKRLRERGIWSLNNRLATLQQDHLIAISVSSGDVKWFSDTRNDIVHNRRAGAYRFSKKGLTYEKAAKTGRVDQDEAIRALRISAALMRDIYTGSAKALRLDKRNRTHKKNLSELDRMLSAVTGDDNG